MVVDGSSMLSLRRLTLRSMTWSWSNHLSTRPAPSASNFQTTWRVTLTSQHSLQVTRLLNSLATPRVVNLSPMVRRVPTLSFHSPQLNTVRLRRAVSWFKLKRCSGPMRSRVPTHTTRFPRFREAALRTSYPRTWLVRCSLSTTTSRISLQRMCVLISSPDPQPKEALTT